MARMPDMREVDDGFLAFPVEWLLPLARTKRNPLHAVNLRRRHDHEHLHLGDVEVLDFLRSGLGDVEDDLRADRTLRLEDMQLHFKIFPKLRGRISTGLVRALKRGSADRLGCGVPPAENVVLLPVDRTVEST